jgi:parallel beta-helix repeat protein
MIAHGYNTIQNIRAENHACGIYFDYAYDNVVENCAAANSLNGIYLHESRRNQLLNNEFLENTYGVVLKTFSDENTLIGNLVADNDYGIDVPGSFSNIIAQNTIRNSAVSGISMRIQPYTSNSLLQPDHNKVYNNDFINNIIQASVSTTGTDNIFNLSAPIGGNYWDSHVSSDSDADGFADTPYIFSGGQDNLPVIRPFNWHPANDDPASNAAKIVDIFDQAALDGTISGNGDPEKLNGFRDKLAEVHTKLEAGELRAAYQLLKTVYDFIDGKGKPKDLVVGPATTEISKMVAELLEQIAP